MLCLALQRKDHPVRSITGADVDGPAQGEAGLLGCAAPSSYIRTLGAGRAAFVAAIRLGSGSAEY